MCFNLSDTRYITRKLKENELINQKVYVLDSALVESYKHTSKIETKLIKVKQQRNYAYSIIVAFIASFILF